MKQYKDNEVVLNVSTQANIRSSKKDNAEMKFNNIKLFVNDMMLVKTIDKPDFSAKKVVNI
jgi:aspartyl-tRNA synthetase